MKIKLKTNQSCNEGKSGADSGRSEKDNRETNHTLKQNSIKIVITASV